MGSLAVRLMVAVVLVQMIEAAERRLVVCRFLQIAMGLHEIQRGDQRHCAVQVVIETLLDRLLARCGELWPPIERIRALAGLDLGELADDRDARGFGKAGFSKPRCQAALMPLVNPATFLMCVTAASPPAVFVKRSSVSSPSSPTGMSA